MGAIEVFNSKCILKFLEVADGLRASLDLHCLCQKDNNLSSNLQPLIVCFVPVCTRYGLSQAGLLPRGMIARSPESPMLRMHRHRISSGHLTRPRPRD